MDQHTNGSGVPTPKDESNARRSQALNSVNPESDQGPDPEKAAIPNTEGPAALALAQQQKQIESDIERLRTMVELAINTLKVIAETPGMTTMTAQRTAAETLQRIKNA